MFLNEEQQRQYITYNKSTGSGWCGINVLVFGLMVHLSIGDETNGFGYGWNIMQNSATSISKTRENSKKKTEHVE